MQNFVKCWQCEHYIWFSTHSDNSSALCGIKKCFINANEIVCEHFVLNKGIHTKRAIPKYIIEHQKSNLKKS